MPVNKDQLKQRINEVLEAKSELKRLTSKPYANLSLEEKYAIRYHIATEDFKREPQSYSECFKIMEEKAFATAPKT